MVISAKRAEKIVQLGLPPRTLKLANKFLNRNRVFVKKNNRQLFSTAYVRRGNFSGIVPGVMFVIMELARNDTG